MTIARTRLAALVLAAAFVAAACASISGATSLATQPANTAAPVLSGTPKEGQTLSTTSGSWSGTTPMTFTYQWGRCDSTGNACANITGATGQTYALTSDDVGHTLRSHVTARNSAGATTATSAQSATVTAGTPPANTALPAVSGTAQVGQTLTSSTGTWSGTTPITYTYAWLRCDASGNNCSGIGAHSDNQTYVVTDSDTGHTLRVAVTASNGSGSAQASSKATAVVTLGPPVNTALPQITGATTSGQKLTASNGTWAGNPTSYTYAWQRCDAAGNACATISGASASTYTTTDQDVGHTIRIEVTAKNATGSKAADSATVGPITAAPPTLPPGAVKLPDGEISVPASSIPDTDRLTIVSVKYTPTVFHGRGPVTATVKVIDNNKYVISGALLYVLPAPRNFANHPAEVATAQDGTASVSLTLTAAAPHTGALLLFIRARTPQGNLLAGSSTRRLVQVRIAKS